MLSGFLKVFTHISKFKNEGSFEGWIRRIMVNTCISYLRKKNPVQLTGEDFVFNDQATKSLETTEEEDIQRMIDCLPIGYKMVFNLYAIEGYKHAEIAKELGITVSTSKSQLFKARKWLQAQYLKLNETVHGDK
jgi:RNA polymerase sigma-70 factor (ECF subfamily)